MRPRSRTSQKPQAEHHNRENVDKRAGSQLESFIDALNLKYQERYRDSLGLVSVAGLFREHFRVPVPLSIDYLYRLLSQLEIDVCVHDVREKLYAVWSYLPDDKMYVINVYTDPSVSRDPDIIRDVLHELYEIIYLRCKHRVGWWQVWCDHSGNTNADMGADCFAELITAPPNEFRKFAETCGFDPQALTNHFNIRPQDALLFLRLYVLLPCPMLLLRLNFKKVPQVQLILDLEDTPSRMAQVWHKTLKKQKSGTLNSGASSCYTLMSSLRDKLPSKNAELCVTGELYEAIAQDRPVVLETSEVLGVRLASPVLMVARPNTPYHTQLFIQIVPAKYANVILTDDLRQILENKPSDKKVQSFLDEVIAVFNGVMVASHSM